MSVTAVGSLQVNYDGTEVAIAWTDGAVQTFNRFWLRDNCPSDGERASLFRSFSVSQIPDDLTIVDARSSIDGATVEVDFNDGMSERFDAAWLNSQQTRSAASRQWLPTWRSDHTIERYDARLLRVGERHHMQLLETVATSGVALVHDIPNGVAGTAVVAALLGPIRETDFGRIFDIIVDPEPFTPSQSATALDPHTDDPYRYTPTGISVLHCVEPSSGTGGASIVVDGFAVVDALRAHDPQAVRLLSEHPALFVHRRPDRDLQGDDVHLRAEAPIIKLDKNGQPAGIRFHERSMASLELPPDVTDDFYRAFISFSRLVGDADFQWSRKLESGEALIYDNQRVLHGRTAFAGSQTRRHLRLCTVDRDQVHSRLRRLREQFGVGTENERLAAGNLS